MSKIQVLDQNTINKIAAGEVIERPASVVKELIENAIDAGSTAIAVELKDGGISLVRVTDNGSGIDKEDVQNAFLRHSTSKIKSVEDLFTITSLGFRGEALSSIASISQVELITKVKSGLTGIKYSIEGGSDKSFEEIGAPDGTTFLVRNLFFNTPARRKFLKAPATEAAHVGDLIERLALSHPNISFKFINNNQIKLHTSGNNQLKDVIYGIYGREITSNLISISASNSTIQVQGFIGKPVIARGNRSYENYYINGRYVKAAVIGQAIEDAYKTYMPQHKYPFTVLHFTINADLLDINVHPTKMELRFKNKEELYSLVFNSIKDALGGKELIPTVSISSTNERNAKTDSPKIVSTPEPFEKRRIEQNAHSTQAITQPISNINNYTSSINELSTRLLPTSISESNTLASYNLNEIATPAHPIAEDMPTLLPVDVETTPLPVAVDMPTPLSVDKLPQPGNTYEQVSLTEAAPLLSKSAKASHRIIGQLFKTYWLVEFDEKLYIIDQHAAHERVLYEVLIKSLKDRTMYSQQLMPPIVISLSMREADILRDNMSHFEQIGFEIESFGGKDYAIKAVPANLFNIVKHDLFIELLDTLNDEQRRLTSETVLDKIAKLSCKAAVKGNNHLSEPEVKQLIDDLLELDNPYTCPHGRPTIISMTQYELEKKFKRIQ